jgi:hypothetical protein
MKAVDLKSVLVAGAIGAVLLLLVDMVLGASAQPSNASSPMSAVGAGFVVGAGVQIGMRISGVS